MKVLNKTRWGAIALIFVMVLASGLTLTGCDFGLGTSRGFDPVGTWSGTYTGSWWSQSDQRYVHWRDEYTITLWPNGTGTLRIASFRNNILNWTDTFSIPYYSVHGNYIILIFKYADDDRYHIAGEILANNRLRLSIHSDVTYFIRM